MNDYIPKRAGIYLCEMPCCEDNRTRLRHVIYVPRHRP
jgi:hypothetical protein